MRRNSRQQRLLVPFAALGLAALAWACGGAGPQPNDDAAGPAGQSGGANQGGGGKAGSAGATGGSSAAGGSAGQSMLAGQGGGGLGAMAGQAGGGGGTQAAGQGGGGGNMATAGFGGGAMPAGGQAGGHRTFLEIDGLVAAEAEHFFENVNNDRPRAWYFTSTDVTPGVKPDPDPNHAASASGGAYMEILPDTRVTHDDPLKDGLLSHTDKKPTLRFKVRFSTTGKYWVWVRAYSTGGEDNGVHVGLDGQWPASGSKLQFCSGKNAWTWSSAQRDSDGPCGKRNTSFIVVENAGEHLVEFGMREDGFEFDKFVLTTDANYTPSGAGPAEM